MEQEFGGFIEIGEAFEVSYLRESHFHESLFPGNNWCRTQLSHPQPVTYYQKELEREWQADPRPAVSVDPWVGVNSQTTHQVKGAARDPRRIHRLEKPNPRWGQTYELISTFRCRSCPYGSDALPHRNPPSSPGRPRVTTAVPNPPIVPKCYLGLLNDDILAEIADMLTSESLISFGKAYPRTRNVISSMHILIRRELTCFYLRTPVQDSVLGIGVSVDRRQRTLSSDFDWLSYEAFNDHDVRKSIQKRPFEFFLPLAFNRPHFQRAYNYVWPALNKIDLASGGIGSAWNASMGASTQPLRAIWVLYRMMNNIVVSLMKSCDDVLQAPASVHHQQGGATLLYVSEKAVIAYCHLLHLVLCLARTNPAIVDDAMSRLKRFRDQPASRVKRFVPDLGEFIILIVLVHVLPSVKACERIGWQQLSGAFLEEVTIRNVRWILQKSPELGNTSDQGANDYRLNTTFYNARTSLRLIMFQIMFLDLFTRVYGGQHGLSTLDDNYGFAEEGMPEQIVKEIKAIYQVKSWPDYFARVKYEQAKGFTKARFCDMLRDAVKTSLERGYHTGNGFGRYGRFGRG